MKKSNRGFTLIEVSVALAITAMLAMLAVPNLMEEVNERRANVTIQETQMIVDAAREYRQVTGAWPGNATCLNAIAVLKTTSPPMLNLPNVINKYNSPITTSCTAFTFSVDQSAALKWDGFLANGIPGTSIVNPATYSIRTTIGIPGSEPALDAKLSRLATGNAELNRMRATLLLGNNDISEVKNIYASNLTAAGNVSTSTLTTASNAVITGALTARSTSQFDKTVTFNDIIALAKVVTIGSGCSPTGAIARDSIGQTVSCQSGVWALNKASLPAGVSCGLASNILGSYVTCEGYNVNSGCPPGYTRKYILDGNAGGYQYIHSCYKN